MPPQLHNQTSRDALTHHRRPAGKRNETKTNQAFLNQRRGVGEHGVFVFGACGYEGLGGGRRSQILVSSSGISARARSPRPRRACLALVDMERSDV